MDIADRVHTLYDCERLAIQLWLPDDFVTGILQETRNPHAVAYEVLKEWSKGDFATGKALHSALSVRAFQDIGRDFKTRLETQGLGK